LWKEKRSTKHTFFFTFKDGFSNWHMAPFDYRGHTFNCVEQFMMYSKARLFNDLEVAAKILATPSPKEQKALGRQVKGFDEALWAEKCEHIVHVGCRENFRQNPHLLSLLMSTGRTALVEASPYDRIWGVDYPWTILPSMTNKVGEDKINWESFSPD
jgi:ribA/ribD-fused uncharacterized protein